MLEIKIEKKTPNTPGWYICQDSQNGDIYLDFVTEKDIEFQNQTDNNYLVSYCFGPVRIERFINEKT